MSTSNFKVYTTFNKLLLLLENALKLNFEAENLNPLQGQPPTHSDPIIKLGMDLSWHVLNSMIQVKTLCHIENQGFGCLWLSKTHQLNPTEAEPSFRKVCLPPAKLHMLFPTYL